MDETPDWVAHENARKKADAAEQAARDQQTLNMSTMLSAQGPDVWQRFTNALKANAIALSKLEGEQLSGSTTPPGTTFCQVNVTWHNTGTHGPNTISWNFHYAPNGIRLVVVGQPEFLFHFRQTHEGKAGIGYGDDVLSAETMAEVTLKEMRKRARTSSAA
jgi:hypothetical protein